MASSWLRHDASFGTHPATIKAGYHGKAVVVGCWELAKLHDNDDGDVTEHWNEYTLLRQTLLDQERMGKRWLATGMQQALDSGLIRHDGKRYWIHNWRKRNPVDPTAAARKRKSRQKNPEPESSDAPPKAPEKKRDSHKDVTPP